MASADKETIYEGKILTVERLEGKWEVVRHQPAVAVLVLNGQGEMLLVRQARPAIGAHTVEAPAGLIDEGETPEQAARRELQEEAGFDAELTLLTRFFTSPGFCDEELHVFRARDLRESRLPQDEGEDLEVLWMTPQALLDGLRDGTLVSSGPSVAAALYGVLALNTPEQGQ